jgi:aspartokinase
MQTRPELLVELEGPSFLDKTLETRAAYWESRIRTYGFQRVTGLSLFEMTVGRTKIDLLGLIFCRLGDAGVGFHLVSSRPSSRGLEVLLLAPTQWAEVIEEGMQEFVEGTDKFMRRTSPAELVFFQGPHFGDRYGIVDTALRALAAKGVKMTATVCSGSCVYLVLPEGKSEEAVAALSEVFEIPKVSSQKRSVPAG